MLWLADLKVLLFRLFDPSFDLHTSNFGLSDFLIIFQAEIQATTLNMSSEIQVRAQLCKTNDVVSKRFVKISNVNILNLPIFFVEKM